MYLASESTRHNLKGGLCDESVFDRGFGAPTLPPLPTLPTSSKADIVKWRLPWLRSWSGSREQSGPGKANRSFCPICKSAKHRPAGRKLSKGARNFCALLNHGTCTKVPRSFLHRFSLTIAG